MFGRYINGQSIRFHDLGGSQHAQIITLPDGNKLTSYEKAGEFVITGTVYGSPDIVRQVFPNLTVSKALTGNAWDVRS